MKHLPAESRGKVVVRMRDQLRAQGASAPGDCRDYSVNAVRRSAGHEADDQLLAVFRSGWSLHAATLEQFLEAEKLNCTWANEPTPDPSQEGNGRHAPECLLPSWEGPGVGSSGDFAL